MSQLLDGILNRGPAPGGFDDEDDDINAREYRAFKIGERTVECELRTVNPVQNGLPFAYTYNTIAYTGNYSFFWTVTSFFLLKVQGRNLRPIVRALRNRKVAWLQEFDKSRHEIPDDPGAPVITRMEVIIQPAGESYKQAADGFGAG